MIVFLVKKEPRSINAKNSLQKYKNDIGLIFEQLNIPGTPLNAELYSKVYYFHKKRTALDADNLSKPVHDALRGKAFIDDNLVKLRSCATVDISNEGINELNITNIPEIVLLDLLGSIDVEEHILYIEIGEFSREMITFGGVSYGA